MAASSAQAEPPPAVDPGWRSLHLWQIQPVRDALLLLALLGAIYLGYVLRTVTVPLLLALTLAYLFEPLIARLVRIKGISREGAAVGIIVVAGLVIVLPVTIGLGFAVVQGTSAAGAVATNATRAAQYVRSTDPAERAEALAALPATFWRGTARWMDELRVEVERYNKFLEAQAREREHQTPKGESPLDHSQQEQGERDQPQQDQPEPGEGEKQTSSLAEQPAPKSADAGTGAETPADAAALPPIPAWKVQIYSGATLMVDWLRSNAGAIAQTLGERAIGTGGEALAIAMRTLGSIAKLLFLGFLTAFFFFFIASGYQRVIAFGTSLIPQHGHERWLGLLRQMDAVIAGFVRGRLTICAILAVYMTIAYWFIGVPAPLVLGPAIGLLFLVPFVHILGVPAAMILMLLEPSGQGWQLAWWWIVFAPIVVYLGGQLLDDYVLTPTIQGRATGMDTPSILFSSIAGGVLAGIYGLLLAIPVAACVKILLREVALPRVRAWSRGQARDMLPIDGP